MKKSQKYQQLLNNVGRIYINKVYPPNMEDCFCKMLFSHKIGNDLIKCKKKYIFLHKFLLTGASAAKKSGVPRSIQMMTRQVYYQGIKTYYKMIQIQEITTTI